MKLTDAEFKSEVEDFDGVVLVDFWAEWCGPCHAIAPTIEGIATDYKDNSKVKVLKLNVDENPQTAQKFSVMSIPTMLVFKSGQPAASIIGVQPKENITAEIDKALT